MKLSIVIPAWNEALKIDKDITTLDAFLVEANLSGEIIIVDDGSDDNTDDIANSVKVSDSVGLNIIKCETHHGKGFAVRKGILAASGELILIIDSGNNVPLSYISLGINLISNKGADIAIGSRHLPESKIIKNMIWYRRVISYIFRKYVNLFFRPLASFSDTQCGFKIFRGDIARELFRSCRSEGFLFDIEILLSALKKEYKIIEFPLEWTCDRDSRLTLLPTFLSVLKELKRLKNAI